MASASPVYSKLPGPNSIRLLRLQPSEDEAALSCSLTVFEDYQTAPPYHCLSYCWGNANDTDTLLCNGVPINITKNLCAALRRLWHQFLANYVWVRMNKGLDVISDAF